MQANCGNNCIFCAMKPGHTSRVIGKFLDEVGLMLPMEGAGTCDQQEGLRGSLLVLLRSCLCALL